MDKSPQHKARSIAWILCTLAGEGSIHLGNYQYEISRVFEIDVLRHCRRRSRYSGPALPAGDNFGWVLSLFRVARARLLHFDASFAFWLCLVAF